MQFQSLEITNFMSIGQAHVDLKAGGLHLVQGVNLDDSSASSNGSGKSSIPDALMWCLFGATARGESSDSVVNRTAKKDCRVAVTLEAEGKSYLIERHRKAALGKNRVTIKETDAGLVKQDLTAGSDAATEEIIARIIGCNQMVFQAAVYAAQENMPNLPDLSDKFLKQIVEEAAGINVLSECLTVARSRGHKIAGDLKSAESQIKFVEMNIHNNTDLAEKALAKAESWESDTETAIGKVKELIKAAEAEYALKKAEADKNEVELAEINAEIKLTTEELEAAKKLNEEVKLAEKEFNASEIKFTRLKTEMNGLARQLKAKSEEMNSGMSKIGKPCSACGKEVCEEDLESVLKAIRDDLAKIAAEFKTAKEAVSIAELERNTASSKLESVRAKVKDVPKLISRAEFLVGKKKALALAPDNLRIIQARIDGHKTTLNNLLASENPYVENHKELLKLLNAANEAKDHLQEKIEALKQDAKINDEVIKIYGPAGVRAHILDHVTPFLNNRTAHYLDALTDGNISAVWSTIKLDSKGEYKEKFNIQVKSNTGGHVYGLLSGGEKRKVRIATSLALQDLIASRATKPFNLFIADEIDDALDESGMERLMSLLEDLSTVRGTVIVISHNELSKWIPNQTVVTKSGGKATIAGSLAIC